MEICFSNLYLHDCNIQIIKLLYNQVKDLAFFTLDDMKVAIAQANLLTAYGYSGNEALELSNTELESMNSTKMNVKMYAEVFRMLGWISPYKDDKAYPLAFT
ncbi:MAG: hypothetical protein NC299_06510 [Lachnospiraceae bacterium]|nr:hypothetical protein [Ruminococcus sp.]MCM1275006.1 hypothetical protein [Lachnospiraceae bacterium]